ncbi:ATPase domain protein, prokaryote domain protein [Candidatus Magnetomoraceae bacterium gMMP-13]
MKYPLSEDIGDPSLFVGRKKEFAYFNKWISWIHIRAAKSHAIFSRRKSGKTALVQRIFNLLWNENGKVIPIFFTIPDLSVWLPNFAIDYYRIFASNYISFLERDEEFIENTLKIEEIEEYGKKNSITSLIRDVSSLIEDEAKNRFDLMWKTANTAPHRFASVYNLRFLIIIDEFQHLSKYITADQEKKIPLKSMPGSYHKLSESKIAPMLVTGSYTNWMNNIIHEYLKAGRLKKYFMSPYLAPDEGLEAVKKYADYLNEPITSETEKQLNLLCHYDPFFISSVIKSNYKKKDLTTKHGVIETVHFEIANRQSEMSSTWREYIDKTLEDINNIHAKKILLYMSKDPKRVWTPKELKEELNLEINERDILLRLRKLEKADLIEEGVADIEFQGLNDGTLHLILRSRYGKEIKEFEPDLRVDFAKQLDEMEQEIKKLEYDKKSISGQLSNLMGEVAEDRLAKMFRNEKRFSLSKFFDGVQDKTKLNIIDVRTRVMIQRKDGKNLEIDIKAESDCGRVILVEVKKWKRKVSINVIKDFLEKIDIFQKDNPDKRALPAIFSQSGLSGPARKLCEDKGIGFCKFKEKEK